MKILKKTMIPILLATLWISFSEFFRNEFLLNTHWINHYEHLGLTFPSNPINGAIWGLWSLVLAVAMYIVAKKFNLLQTTLLSWLFAFVLMWLVTGNMMVLPFSILFLAIPLSLLEVFLAALIIKKLS